MPEAKKYLEKIRPPRLEENLWRLVEIPSPTGHERRAALAFAQMLRQAGAATEVDETLPESPCVIGRLKGNRPGRVLQLAGHLDHINIPHEKPRRENGTISGRGSADMKNGLAGILEIIHILQETHCDFPGEILVTAYGLHEAPDGRSEGLEHLLDRGIKGDAAIVFEGPEYAVAIMANGMAIWNLQIRGPQPACHEFSAQPEAADLWTAVGRCLLALQQKRADVRHRSRTYPLLAQESLFIGQVRGGDFYNRQPDVCTLQGTRRWHPDQTFEAVQKDWAALLEAIPLPRRITIRQDWQFVGDSYEVSPQEPIVQSLVRSFEAVHGKHPPIQGHNSVTDVCRLVRNGGIPAVLCGFGTETGHGDYEFITTDRLVVSCRVALLTVLDYLNTLSS